MCFDYPREFWGSARLAAEARLEIHESKIASEGFEEIFRGRGRDAKLGNPYMCLCAGAKERTK